MNFCFCQIWRVLADEQSGKVEKIEYVASLSRHTKAVNVVRFSPCGELKEIILITCFMYVHFHLTQENIWHLQEMVSPALLGPCSRD